MVRDTTPRTPAGSMSHLLMSADGVDRVPGLGQGALGGGVVLLEGAAAQGDDRADLTGGAVPAALLVVVLVGDAVGLEVGHGLLDVGVALADQRLQLGDDGV